MLMKSGTTWCMCVLSDNQSKQLIIIWTAIQGLEGYIIVVVDCLVVIFNFHHKVLFCQQSQCGLFILIMITYKSKADCMV